MTLLAADICASIDTLAMTYLDDELAEEELRDLELHLHDCASCRDKVELERSALAALRRQLAPPPAPDVVRARLSAALDAEDALGARSRVTAWLLPAAASLAAAAALVLFVFGRPEAPAASAAQVVEDVVRPKQPKNAPVPVRLGGADDAAPIDRAAATWITEVRDRPTLNMLFQGRSPLGDEIVIQASVLDGRGLNLCDGDRVEVQGLSMCADEFGGQAFIVHTDDAGVAYVFTSESWGIGHRELLNIIIEHRLVRLINARIGR